MPTYLDVHGLGNVTEDQIKQAQNAPKDEFGVTHKNMLYNIEEIDSIAFWTHLTKMLCKNIIKNLV
jgi:hypothetical protein